MNFIVFLLFNRLQDNENVLKSTHPEQKPTYEMSSLFVYNLSSYREIKYSDKSM